MIATIRTVYVDERDIAWVSDWGGNAVVSFDPRSEKFDIHHMPHESANIRRILGARARSGCRRAARNTSA